MLADIDELEKDIDIVDLLESPVEEPAAWLHYLNVRIRDDGCSVRVYTFADAAGSGWTTCILGSCSALP